MDKQIHCFFGPVGHVDLHRFNILLYVSWILLTAWGSDLPFVIFVSAALFGVPVHLEGCPVPSLATCPSCGLKWLCTAGYHSWLMGMLEERNTSPPVQSQASLLGPGWCPGPRIEEASRSFCFSLLVQVSIICSLSSPSRLSWGRIEMGPCKAHGMNLENIWMHPAFSVFGSEGHSLPQRSTFSHRENGTRTTQTNIYPSVCSLFLTKELGHVIVLGEPNMLHVKDCFL